MKQKDYDRVKEWREKNPDKHKEQWLRYYHKNADVIKARKKLKYLMDKNETI